MNLFKKSLKIITVLLMFLIIGGAIFLYHSGPELPKETDQLLTNILESPVPEMIHGQTGIVKSQGVDIWYESQMPKDSLKGTILFIMGISNDAMGWPLAFLSAFVQAGYQVIRYDHRGTGLSDWVENWDAEHPYTLSEMAEDGIAILDELKISKAHIIGVSMGGMIAQETVINHPNRVHSLTSIMSSGNIFDTTLPPISSDIAIELIKVAAKYGIIGGERNLIKLHLVSRLILMGDAQQTLNIQEIASHAIYNMRKRKGYNPNVSAQHQAATAAANSRYEALQKLDLPTLIIHGQADPFIPIEHGQKMARMMPNIDSLWVDNMGHDIPDELIEGITGVIVTHLEESRVVE